MSQKGFAPIYLLVALAVVSVVGIIYFKGPGSVKNTQEQASVLTISTSPTPQLLAIKGKLSPTAKPTSSIKLSLTPTTVPTTTSISTPTPPAEKNTCAVNVIYGKLGGGASDPLLVTLVAAFTSSNGAYLAEAQWDFDGNGSWDTDSKSLNGNMEHTYPQAGTFTPKLQVKGSDGSMTGVCNGSLTVPSGTTVRLTGRVYADINCNNTPEPSESGIAGATVQIMKMPEYSVFATLTTDNNGYYNFSQNVQPNDALSVSPTFGAVPSGYKSNPYFNASVFALNSSQSSINVDIPLVPYANLGACQR